MPQRILFRLQLHLRELPGRLCQVGCYVHTAAALGHSYGQFDAVVVHHRARCTVVDIAAADTAVVDHVHPGLIVELVAAGRAHVLWVQNCVLVVAVVAAAAAIADDIVGFAEIAGSEEALVSEGTAYSARGQYMIVDVPMIRRIQLTHASMRATSPSDVGAASTEWAAYSSSRDCRLISGAPLSLKSGPPVAADG